MINHFSFSQLSQLEKCPRAYELRYIEKIPSAVSGDLIRGDAYHKGLAFAFSNIIIYHKIPIIDEIFQVYSDTWDKRLKDKIIIDDEEEISIPSVNFGKKDPGKLKDDGLKLLEIYYNTILPGIIPSKVETRRIFTYRGIPLLSYIDLITWEDVIIDHKMKAKVFSEGELASDLQSTFYALVLDKEEFNFEFHVAVAVKAPRVDIVPIHRTKNDMEWLGNMIVTYWKLIQSGIFPPATAGWWCSKDFCSYWGYCKMPGGF